MLFRSCTCQKTFTDDELHEIKEIFESTDADGNSVLDLDEMKSFFKQLELPVELTELMFALYDKDKNGTIDFDEFCSFVNDMRKTAENPLYFVGILFSALDVDNSGTLSGDEIVTFLRLLGIDSKPEDFGHDEITLAEFLSFIQ